MILYINDTNLILIHGKAREHSDGAVLFRESCMGGIAVRIGGFVVCGGGWCS
jgi:hypothetical protein